MTEPTPDVQPPIAELAELVPAMGLYFADPFWHPLVAAELRRLADGIDNGNIRLVDGVLEIDDASVTGAAIHRPRRIDLRLTCFEATEEQAANESDSRPATSGAAGGLP